MTCHRSSSLLLRTSLCVSLTLGAAACGRADDEELVVGEATAALTVSEEGEGAGTDDALGASSEAELDASVAEEVAAVEPVPQSAGGVCDFEAKRAQVLAEYDTDGNGRLDSAEAAALKGDLDLSVQRPRLARLAWRVRHHTVRRVRWAFDEDGNGQLSDEERAAMVEAVKSRCEALKARVLAAHDADGDGSLNDTEREAAKAAARARLVAKYQQVLAHYDVNGSGTLELSERTQLRADFIARARARRAAVIATFDTNGDGSLNQEEALQLRLALQARIAAGEPAE